MQTWTVVTGFAVVKMRGVGDDDYSAPVTYEIGRVGRDALRRSKLFPRACLLLNLPDDLV